MSDRERLTDSTYYFAELTILSVGLMVLATATAAIRSLPARWQLRGIPLDEYTWPAFGATFLFTALWLSESVMPYRIPGAVDYAGWPILQILHVEKRGLQFHETGVNVLGYRGQAIIQSSANNGREPDSVSPLRAWNVDGWYVTGEEIALKAYTTDKGPTPPEEVVGLFSELMQIPRVRETQSDMKDVCLGFCYDPLSGLGLLYANHRCRYDATRHDYVCR